MTELIRLADVTRDPPADKCPAERWRSLRGGAVAVGNFDGVHRGHQSLLRHLREQADACGGPAVAVSFDPHPAAVLRPADLPPPLTTMAERARRMSHHGVDALIVLRTTRCLLDLDAETFYRVLFEDRLAAQSIVEGPNFFFGRDRAGDVVKLDQWCRRDGRTMFVVHPTEDDGEMISSSRIRNAVAGGDMRAVRKMSGWPHRVDGIVIHGNRRGRTIGFPTANLANVETVLPAPGVYAGLVDGLNQQTHCAAVHIGPVPTFGDVQGTRVEVHVIGFDGDLYGHRIGVDLYRRLRGVEKFDSAEALVQQMRTDVSRATKMMDDIRAALTPPKRQ